MTSTSPAHLRLRRQRRPRASSRSKARSRRTATRSTSIPEMTEMTKNGLQYVTLVQYLNQKTRRHCGPALTKEAGNHEFDNRTRCQCQRTDSSALSRGGCVGESCQFSNDANAGRRTVPPQRRGVSRPCRSASRSISPATGINGVEVAGVIDDPRPFDRRYEPDHPDADADGYVEYPNVNSMEEMANLVEASRSYEANISAMNIIKAMIARTLEIGRDE